MKHIIPFCFMSLLMIGTAQANYAFKIPLEESNGGGLPNGSILIKSSTTTPPVIIPPPAEPTPECIYVVNQTYWKSTIGGFAIRLSWNGELLYSNTNENTIVVENSTSYIHNGYTYTKGKRITFSGPPDFEICRIII